MSAGGGRAGTGYIELRPQLTKAFQKDMERLFQAAVKTLKITIDASKINVTGKVDTTALAAKIKSDIEKVKVKAPKIETDAPKATKAIEASSKEKIRDGRSGPGFGMGLLSGGAALGAGAIGLGMLGKELFEASSTLVEATNKAQVVFGGTFDKVKKQADGAAKSLGMSKAVALDAAGTFGNLFTAMGIAQDPAADMSTSLLQLAADLGSFNNVPVEEVLLALRSGLVGETEPMRRFGVNLNEATLKAEAYRMGLVKVDVDEVKLQKAQLDRTKAQQALTEATKKHGPRSMEAASASNRLAKANQDVEKAMAGSKVELTAAQKAQAAYSLMMQQTTTAQGDFARTSESAANKQKTLAASLEDTKARLGEALAPLGSAVLGTLTTGLDNFNNWWTEHGPGIKTWIHDTFGQDPAASFREGLGKVGSWFTEHVGTVDDFQRGLGLVKSAWDDITGANEHSGSVLSDWHDSAISAIDDFRQGLTNGKEPIQALADGWGRILDKIDGAWDALQGLAEWIRGVGDPFQAFRDGLDRIGDKLSGIWDNEIVKVMTGRSDNPIAKAVFGAGLPKFDTGGVVPGRRGAPRLALVHGGETVLPTHKQAMSQIVPAGDGGMVEATVMLASGEVLGRVVTPYVSKGMGRDARGRRD